MSSIPVENIAQRVYRWKQNPQGPISLEIYPTLKCNLNCQFCDTTDRHRPAVNELSTMEWIEILHQAKYLGIKEVFVLGGGEPFVHVGIMEILYTIKELGFYGIMTTNGTLINKDRSNQLLDMKWDEIHFSIDGATSQTHDTLRGKKGAFKKTVSTLCRLHQKSSYAISLAIHTVVNNKNYHEIPQIVDLAHAVGAQRVDFDDLIAYTPEQRSLILSQNQRQELQVLAQQGLSIAQKYGVATTLAQYTSKNRRLRGKDAPISIGNPIKDSKREYSNIGLEGAPCLKPFYHLTLAADGTSSPCCVLASQGGSIRQNISENKTSSLQHLWYQDPFLQNLRAKMIAHNPIDRCKECSNNILDHEAYIRSHFPQEVN
jgi:MoaA/NifB/PqqE/SkfB family radical SAM enzyme